MSAGLDPSDLVATGDIARELGVTNSAVSNWIKRASDFPAPVLTLSTGSVYSMKAVRAWRIGVQVHCDGCTCKRP